VTREEQKKSERDGEVPHNQLGEYQWRGEEGYPRSD